MQEIIGGTRAQVHVTVGVVSLCGLPNVSTWLGHSALVFGQILLWMCVCVMMCIDDTYT